MTPYPHQIAGAEFLAAARTAILGDFLGGGKTLTAILACDRVKAERITILCPAVFREGWRREVLRGQSRPRAVHVINSAADVLDLSAPVQIVSYALAARPAVRDALRQRGADALICDEGHALKTPDSARTQATYGPLGLITTARRLWILTGTLMPNAPHEAWTHLRAMGRISLTYDAWIRRFCVTKATQYGEVITGANMANGFELADLLRPVWLRRTAQQVALTLPPLRWGQVYLAPDDVPDPPEMTPEIQAILQRLEDGDEITATEKLHLSSLRRWTEMAKAPALIELIRDDLESTPKIILFGIHREALKAMAAAFGSDARELNGDTSIVDRQRIIDAFQNSPQPRLLVCQLAVASTALTLTLTAASNVIFSAISWTPSDMAQAAARAHRIGQTAPVLARVTILSGSIDEAMAAVAFRKGVELGTLNQMISERRTA